MGILLKNARYIITSPTDFFENGSVYIEGNLVKDLGPAASINEKYEKRSEVVKDCSGCILTPGLINSHNHIYELIQRGLGKDSSMEDWLRKVIYPTCKAMDGEDSYYIALLSCMDLARNGSTAVIEQLTNFARLHADQELQALLDFGLRGAITRASSTKSVIDEGENNSPEKELDDARAFLERWKDEELVQAWLGPAGLYSCDPDTLTELKKMSNQYGSRFNIHLSETKFQQEMAIKAGYEGQVKWADAIGILDERTSAAHCVWITEKEIDILRDRKTKVVHNSTSNQILGSGIANIPLMRQKGVSVAIGTDGPASNDSQDMVAEMKASVLLHRVRTTDPRILNSADGFDMATVQGAKVLGIDKLGKLKRGSIADLACFRTAKNPSMLPVYNPIDALVFYGSGRDNVLTIVDGRIVYDNGVYPTIDADTVFEAVEKTSGKIKEVLGL